jgi:hypothetical protein
MAKQAGPLLAVGRGQDCNAAPFEKTIGHLLDFHIAVSIGSRVDAAAFDLSRRRVQLAEAQIEPDMRGRRLVLTGGTQDGK